MTITIGTQLGSHEITALLGKGGMGEVYRARDMRLKREVAIKILPEQFSKDSDRMSRFQREAEVLASLNHPNIAAVYGLEEAAGSQYMVMELVEGETLADRIARGPIPLDEALSIAGHICDALGAAHERGVVHRDLKPANVKVTPEGKVKVLDFGLAKALDRSGSSDSFDPSNSPTLATETGIGIILGTAAYMSPEQARGKAVDKRTDIWAFGCVLYETLTGKQAFAGEDVADTIAAVVRGTPDWNELPAGTPEQIRMLLMRCLENDRNKRLPDISVAQFVMTEPVTAQPATSRAESRRHVRLAAVIGIAAGVVITAAALGIIARLNTAKAPQTVRFTFVPPASASLALGFDRDIAISPDGTRIVYRGGNGQLFVRALDQLDVQPLAGIAGVRSPFISPDGRWVGFFQGTELKKVSISGGTPITLCRVPTGGARGASWGTDDTVVFATGDTATGLLSVPANGGEPKVLTRPEPAQGEADHVFPSVLPGGRGVLFTITTSGQPAGEVQVAVLDLKTGQKKILIHDGGEAEYLDTGHIIYAKGGTLRAVRFDLARLEILGDPVPVLEHVTMSGSGSADFAVSKSGALLFVPGDIVGTAQRSLIWVNRQGREEPIKAPTRAYNSLRLSPDGTRIALNSFDQENDIWIWDLMRQTLNRLTFDPGVDQLPVWTPDSRRILFTAIRGGANTNVFWQAADNTGTAERLTTSPNWQAPLSVSPDGKSVVILEDGTRTGLDLSLLSLDEKVEKRTTTPLINTPFTENGGEISPDGRWLAYESNELGPPQIYVRPFPKVDSGHWQVSAAGGTRPLWARNGKELFYVDVKDSVLMSVQVQTGGPVFSSGAPAKVFDSKVFTASNGRTYDVSSDGQRFVLIKDNAGAGGTSAAPSAGMVVVLNWLEELKARTGS